MKKDSGASAEAAVAIDPPEDKMSVGTLKYTKAGLVVMFGWMLWGDFVFTLFEGIGGPNVLGLYLQNEYHVSNKHMNVLLNIIPQLIGVLVGPILSFKSDRYRSRLGRRIPFIIWTTPFLCLFALAIGYVDEIFAFFKDHVAEGGMISPFSLAMMAMGFLIVGFCFFNEFVNTVYWYLFADVVPPKFMGRFLGMFRMVGAAVGVLVNLVITPIQLTHIKAIHVGVAVLYFVGFTIMCLRVKEGQYPSVTDVSDKTTFMDKVKIYVRECFTHPIFIMVYLSTIMGVLARSGGGSGLFGLHLSKHQATVQASSGPAHTVAMNAAGNLVLTAGAGGAQVWDGIADRKFRSLCSLTAGGTCTSAALAPDGKLAATGGADGTIQLWQVADGQPFKRLDGHTGPVRALAVSPDGKLLASGGEDGKVRLWELDTGRCAQVLSDRTPATATATTAATATATSPADSMAATTVAVRCVAFSSDGQRLASGGQDKTILIWDVSKGSLLQKIEGSPGPVYALAFAPALEKIKDEEKAGPAGWVAVDWCVRQGKRVAGYFQDVFTNESLYAVPADKRSRVVFNDGWLISGGQEGGKDSTPSKLRIWDLKKGRLVDFDEEVKQVTENGQTKDKVKEGHPMALKGHKQAITSIQYKPDLHMILTGSLGTEDRNYTDGMIRLWDPVDISPTAGDQAMRTFTGYTVGVTGLASSQKGPLMVNVSQVGGLHLWDIDAGVSLIKAGQMGAFFGLITFLLAYPLGSLVDRWHPLRITLWGSLALIPIPFISFFVVHDYMSLVYLEMFKVPIFGIVGAAGIPLLISVFPRAKFGQMCSANGLVKQASQLVLGFGGAVVMDIITQDTLLTDNFRYGFLWTGVGFVLYFATVVGIYYHWKKLGGDKGYKPPEIEAADEKAQGGLEVLPAPAVATIPVEEDGPKREGDK